MRLSLGASAAIALVVVPLGAVLFATYWDRLDTSTGGPVKGFLAIFVIAGASAILLGMVLGWLAGRAATRRMVQMSDQMKSVGSGDLEKRVDVPEGRSEMVELGSALNASLERIQTTSKNLAAALSGQRRFVAEASRGLRAPLTSIATSLQAIDGRPEMRDEERRATVERALAEVESMTRLVDGLDLLARIDSGGALKSEPFDWGPFLELALTRGRQICSPRRIAINISPDIGGGRGDTGSLQELFRILFTNVGMHTPESATVTFDAVSRPDGGHDQFIVTDDGPGIPRAIRPSILDPFVSGDRRRSPGLGLAIARAIVEAHGGSIEVRENAPRGVSVRVVLPREPAGPDREKTGERGAASGATRPVEPNGPASTRAAPEAPASQITTRESPASDGRPPPPPA